MQTGVIGVVEFNNSVQQFNSDTTILLFASTCHSNPPHQPRRVHPLPRPLDLVLLLLLLLLLPPRLHYLRSHMSFKKLAGKVM
jgi:hypothetical protein